MANPKHAAILRKGVGAWNRWRKQHPRIRRDLSYTSFHRRNLSGFDLTRADLSVTDLSNCRAVGADFRGCDLYWANLEKARLHGADFREAVLYEAELAGQDLRRTLLEGAVLENARLAKARLDGMTILSASFENADLEAATLSKTTLEDVDFTRANLTESRFRGAHIEGCTFDGATLVGTDFRHASLSDCSVYGISAWDLRLEGALESGLIVTPRRQSALTVDSLEVAQFVYLLLKNPRVRKVIDTITSKVVLILGRFTLKRKAVLDAVRAELRKEEYNYVPVVFDFSRPASRDLEETVTLLARMARFIIADITNPKSIPHELAVIVRDLPSVPVQPILRKGGKPWAMFRRIERYPWVLPVHRYVSTRDLLPQLADKVVRPAEKMADEQQPEADS